MTDQEKLLEWCKKNAVHDYRLGTNGERLLTAARIARCKFDNTKKPCDANQSTTRQENNNATGSSYSPASAKH